MTLVKKHRIHNTTSLVDTLPGMVYSALANREDFVVTYETDKKTHTTSLYVMSGSLVTPEILAALKKEIGHKKAEGSTVVTRDWK